LLNGNDDLALAAASTAMARALIETVMRSTNDGGDTGSIDMTPFDSHGQHCFFRAFITFRFTNVCVV